MQQRLLDGFTRAWIASQGSSIMHTPEGDLEFVAEVILELPDGITQCP